MIRVKNIVLPLGYTERSCENALRSLLGCGNEEKLEYTLAHRSLDCRGRREPRYVCTFDVSAEREEILYENAVRNGAECVYPYTALRYAFPPVCGVKTKKPVVVGFGPAGIFCSLMLAESGLCPVIIERGDDIDTRARKTERFFKTGELDTESNIQFGEGGAGAFSDGKLTTLIKDKDARCAYILRRFVEFGAPEDILYSAHPHIGTDVLRGVIKNMREHIKKYGGAFRFCTRFESVISENGALCGVKLADGEIIDTDTVFLCVGHSARDVFRSLHESGVILERKPFSVGVRIEHLQSAVNKARYHSYAGDGRLPAAEYKAAVHTPNGRTLYTFCMCPGGYVTAAASEERCVVTNGMSFRARDGKNANSALLVSVEPGDMADSSLFAGIEFQRKLEHAAYESGGGEYKAPAQIYADFAKGVKTRSFGSVEPTYPRGVTPTCLKDVLPPFVRQTLAQGIPMIDKLIPGFASPDAVLTGVESRSTCPLRIVRGEDMQSSLKGLYPVGEGAGYAGGIMSAAADGIKCAESYARSGGHR